MSLECEVYSVQNKNFKKIIKEENKVVFFVAHIIFAYDIQEKLQTQN